MSVNNGNGFAKGKAVDVEGAYEEYGDFNDIDRYVDLDLDDDFPEAPQVRTVGVKGNRASLEGAVLKFEKIMFVVGKGKREKIIVKGVSATVNHGHVLAIMGPSGAGKSTLISALTQDTFYGSAFGTVTLSGVPMSDRVFKRYCYVVKQRDTDWPYLTARETLTYAAELYDLAETPDVLVNEVMVKTGLVSCADIGVSHLSGGQQRRLSLAVALLKQPAVLFLDEPTSGLDAASASYVMREITRVAKEERLVIVCTIHQPSTRVYHRFDQLMLLSKGREAYVGSAKEASAYFGSIGYALPPETNPAEHFLDLVNADFSSPEEVDSVLDKWEDQRTNAPLLRSDRAAEKTIMGGHLNHGLFRETKVMFRRHSLLMARDPLLYAGRFVGFLIVNCVFGIVYIAARAYTQDQAINKLWVSGWYIGVPSNMAVVAVYKLNSELRSIFLENKNGMGSAASYLFAKTLLVFPILFCFALAALGIPGFLIQNFPASTFSRQILLWTVQIAAWECSAEAFAAIFDDAVLGMLIHTGWWFAALLFSGYLVSVDDMFWPLKVFYCILPYNYYIRSAMFLIFTESTWEACTDPTTSAVCVNSTDGLLVLDAFSRVFPLVTTENTYWSDVGYMVCIGLFWKIVGVVSIVTKARRVSPVHDRNLGQTIQRHSADTRESKPATEQEEKSDLKPVDDNVSEQSFQC